MQVIPVIRTGDTYQSYVQVNMQVEHAGLTGHFCSIMLFKLLSGLYISPLAEQVIFDVKDSIHSGQNSGHYQVIAGIYSSFQFFPFPMVIQVINQSKFSS